jgi:hypothetical protein
MHNFSGNAGSGNISANGGDGGGIWNSGTMALYRSTVAGNAGGIGGDAFLVSLGSGSGGKGGGAYNAGHLALYVCSISDNFAGRGGNGAPGYMDLGWQGTAGSGGLGGSGGGIYNERSLTVGSCTISANRAGAGGAGGNGDWLDPNGGSGGPGGTGGGIFNYNSQTSASLRNTLVALNLPGLGGVAGVAYGAGIDGNVGVDGSSPDLAGAFISQGFNLIGAVDGGIGFIDGVHADHVGSFVSPIDPLIGPLQDNGGDTFTHALLPGSPAIDQGQSFGLHTDQRGHHRPFDYHSIPDAPGGDGSDIGAFELDMPILGMRKLANKVVFSWDTFFSGYTLEATSDLTLSNGWMPVTGAPAIKGSEYQLTNTANAAFKFFRLRRN